MERVFASKSAILSDLLKIVEVAANTSSAVLVAGGDAREKEFFARLLHFDGARRENSFVRVNCANLAEEALAKIRDAFSRARGGTVFFDEVANLSLEAQSLLFGLIHGKDERNARVVAATGFTLSEMVERGEFSVDLLSALNGVVLRLPNLNPRFYENFSVENAGQGDFFALFTRQGQKELKDAENIFKRNYLRSVLETVGFNQTRAAEILGIQRTYLSRLLGKLDIRK